MAGLIAAGYADLAPLSLLHRPRVPGDIAAAVAAIVAAPVLPLVSALLARYARLRLPGLVLVPLTVCCAVLGVLLTLAAMMDGGSALAFLEGLMLTLAVVGGLQMLGRATEAGELAALLMALPTLLALWSLATVPAAAVSALKIAAGHPYCIARHGDTHPIDSWAELRGLSLYTTRTGFKSTSHWYLHAVLIVEADADWSVWNWSFGAMGFTPLPHPDWLTERAGSECTPEPSFLATLAPF
ncbi:hypothetical protein [Rhodobacter capsulatus]|jgi:hypothetical protein|nr:hypothetical protein [Rhodobacter capsulatus]ETE52174.1 hypothetical protein U715_18400 [Rhodobacter capsulatus Y262]MDS0927655.1 hypothetical protein [Rhodobacter capsulatus]